MTGCSAFRVFTEGRIAERAVANEEADEPIAGKLHLLIETRACGGYKCLGPRCQVSRSVALGVACVEKGSALYCLARAHHALFVCLSCALVCRRILWSTSETATSLSTTKVNMFTCACGS